MVTPTEFVKIVVIKQHSKRSLNVWPHCLMTMSRVVSPSGRLNVV